MSYSTTPHAIPLFSPVFTILGCIPSLSLLFGYSEPLPHLLLPITRPSLNLVDIQRPSPLIYLSPEKWLLSPTESPFYFFHLPDIPWTFVNGDLRYPVYHWSRSVIMMFQKNWSYIGSTFRFRVYLNNMGQSGTWQVSVFGVPRN